MIILIQIKRYHMVLHAGSQACAFHRVVVIHKVKPPLVNNNKHHMAEYMSKLNLVNTSIWC